MKASSLSGAGVLAGGAGGAAGAAGSVGLAGAAGSVVLAGVAGVAAISAVDYRYFESPGSQETTPEEPDFAQTDCTVFQTAADT